MANGLGSLQVFNPQSVFPRGFSIGMDPRPFLARSGFQIQGNRVVPMPGFSQPTAPAPQPVAPQPVAPPVAQPTPQPTPPPMIPQPQPALPSEQLNIQPPMGIPTTPPARTTANGIPCYGTATNDTTNGTACYGTTSNGWIF